MTTPDDDTIHECDAFRKLEAIYSVDPRYAARAVLDPKGARPVTVEDHWNDIALLGLHDSVPRVIPGHFETARNLLLYSWHAYRFHQVAEMHAFASVEYALRLRNKLACGKRCRYLGPLLARAVKEGWIRDEGFRHYRQIVERRAQYEEAEGSLTGQEHEPEATRAVQAFVRVLCKHLPELRSKLAHGSPRLTPSGKKTLALCCDLINQLFPEGVRMDVGLEDSDE
jgi:hypothetical protein